MNHLALKMLQIIFELDPPESPLYVGQQVDVFIQRPDLETVHND
jgi:hypothetical protein